MIIVSNSGELFEIFLGDGPISESPIRNSITELIHWCVYTVLYEAFCTPFERDGPYLEVLFENWFNNYHMQRDSVLPHLVCSSCDTSATLKLLCFP